MKNNRILVHGIFGIYMSEVIVIGTNQLVVSSIYFDLLYFYRRERERERDILMI